MVQRDETVRRLTVGPNQDGSRHPHGLAAFRRPGRQHAALDPTEEGREEVIRTVAKQAGAAFALAVVALAVVGCVPEKENDNQATTNKPEEQQKATNKQGEVAPTDNQANAAQDKGGDGKWGTIKG